LRSLLYRGWGACDLQKPDDNQGFFLVGDRDQDIALPKAPHDDVVLIVEE
jgi:hypothetical protein